jgi:hypothetical protein
MDAEPDGPDEAVLGIRPETIAPEGGAHDAKVVLVEFSGATTTLLVRWAGTDVHITSARRLELRPGDTIRPRIDRRRAVLFPTEREGAIE